MAHIQDFREERDKLVSGLEAILKKKDAEIKIYKEQIKQLKDKEELLTKVWLMFMDFEYEIRHTVMILSFRTDSSGQTVHTQIRLLL